MPDPAFFLNRVAGALDLTFEDVLVGYPGYIELKDPADRGRWVIGADNPFWTCQLVDHEMSVSTVQDVVTSVLATSDNIREIVAAIKSAVLGSQPILPGSSLSPDEPTMMFAVKTIDLEEKAIRCTSVSEVFPTRSEAEHCVRSYKKEDVESQYKREDGSIDFRLKNDFFFDSDHAEPKTLEEFEAFWNSYFEGAAAHVYDIEEVRVYVPKQ